MNLKGMNDDSCEKNVEQGWDDVERWKETCANAIQRENRMATWTVKIAKKGGSCRFKSNQSENHSRTYNVCTLSIQYIQQII